MEINGRVEGDGVLVVELREDNLDAGNVREFRDALQSLVQDRTRVVLDLSGVQFIDSSGLGALLGTLRQLNGRKGDMRLCEMSRTVRALFELMRMHKVFAIHESRDDAVESYA
jgi:anti-sigma B factor antagonist